MPKSLVGKSMKVVWTSPLASKQNERKADSIIKTLQDFAMVVQTTQNPQVLERLDFDALSAVLVDVRGIPRNIIRSDVVIKKEREARQAAQAQQLQQEQAMQQMQQAATMESQTGSTKGPINKLMGMASDGIG